VHGTIDTRLDVEWRPLATLGDIVEPWQALTACAVESNAFYEPVFALTDDSLARVDSCAAA
jgi:hypothetical protein